MKVIKWAILLFFIVLALLWILYFYLQHDKEKVVHKPIEKSMVVQQIQPHERTVQETILAFCNAFYNGKDITPYTTEHGKASVTPLSGGEKLKNQKVDVRVKIGKIEVFSGEITKENADSIVAIERTISVQSSSTTNVQYIRLHLVKKDSWRMDQIVLLADVPTQ